LTIDCEICGEPVVLTPARYLAMKRAGERPRCRKNGCERLCGAKTPRRSRTSEVLAVQDVALLRVRWPAKKRGKPGRKHGVLAKLGVSRDGEWRYEGCGDNG